MGIALASLASGPAHAQALTEVPVICKEQLGREYLRPCDEVKSRLVESLNQVVDARMDDHYADTGAMGWLPKVSMLGGTGSPQINACTLVPIPRRGFPSEGAGSDEPSSNHAGQPCGQYCELTVDVHINFWDLMWDTLGAIAAALCSAVDWVPGVDCPPPPSLEEYGELKENLVAPKCVREDSFLRGAYIQLLECHRATVVNEINSGQLKITPAPGGGPGACQDMAADIMQFEQQATTVENKLIKKFDQSIGLVSRVEECQGDSTGFEPFLVSVCHVSAAREGLHSSFIGLAACETFARANRQWVTKFASSASITTDLQEGVRSTCNSECRNEFGLDTPGAITQKINECVRDCYRREVPIRLKARLEAEFPVAGCSP